MVKRTGGALLLAVNIDRNAPQPVGSQLLAALRRLVVGGALGPGERLPATRTLARELGVSRNTVVEAFERLAAEGLVDSRVGAGTYVTETLRRTPPRGHPTGAVDKTAGPVAGRPRVARQLERSSTLFAERLPHPPRAFTNVDAGLRRLPAGAVGAPGRQALARPSQRGARLRRPARLLPAAPRGGGAPEDQPRRNLRARAGLHRRRRAARLQVIADVLLDPGDKVWFENPGAMGARNALLARGADVVPVPVDAEGISVDAGLAAAPEFKLAFVTPSHQHPLGVTMSLARRLALLAAAEAADAYIIEDDYDGEFCYGTRPLPALRSIDARERVIYVGTFSKSLFPALRLGYFVCPAPLVPLVGQVSSAYLQEVASNPQAVVADFIDEGHFATHLRRMRRLYAERHQVLLDCARAELAGRLDVRPTDSGLHTIGLVADGIDEEALTRAAADREVTVAPSAASASLPSTPAASCSASAA
ncbi:MAG: PLP-dependent aminotransferase family protein [Gammaproteobacteria bacterium]|nr:PLP-dependent aminotransferase family protein [Gammaproteobacteria bacterium]